MWAFFSYGAILGLSAGISPGPLLALVISQTLQYNTREGIRVALAPIITDAPIILIGLLAFSALPNQDLALGIVSFVGSVFVCYLGISSLRQGPPDLDVEVSVPRSYLKGVLVNALSPHPYLFWFAVGIPTLLKAHQETAFGAVGFVVAFYLCIVGSKVIIAMLVGRSRGFLSGAAYLWTMRVIGLLLIAFAVVLFMDGVELTGWLH